MSAKEDKKKKESRQAPFTQGSTQDNSQLYPQKGGTEACVEVSLPLSADKLLQLAQHLLPFTLQQPLQQGLPVLTLLCGAKALC